MATDYVCPCTTCGTNIEFPEEYEGQQVACPSCDAQTLLTVRLPTVRKPTVAIRKPAVPDQPQHLAGGTKFCHNCGSAIAAQAVFCVKCGVATGPVATGPVATRDFATRDFATEILNTDLFTGRGAAVALEKPENHLGTAIAVTLVCCFPAGIVSIVYACQVNGKWDAGDHAGAIEASGKAKMWNNISLIAAIVVVLIGVLSSFLQER